MATLLDIVTRAFWSKVEVAGPDDCWLWTGRGQRYGVFNIGHTSTGAHRVSWELANGEVPEGHDVHHTCPNGLCVNPAHLEAKPAEEHDGLYWRNLTHCPRGHAFDEANTYRTKQGHRRCRRCHADREARRQRRKAGR